MTTNANGVAAINDYPAKNTLNHADDFSSVSTNATSPIAHPARHTCSTSGFGLKRQSGKFCRAGCGKLRPSPKRMVHSNTLKSAVHFPTVSGILLCPEFSNAAQCRVRGCGLGAMVRKAIGVTDFTFETPSPPDARSNAEGGFSIQSGTETMKTITTGTPAQNTNDHTSLSFVRVEHHGKRNQRLTHWFDAPAESYVTGNATGFKLAKEFMAWLQNRPADYETGMIVREVMQAAFAVLSEPCKTGQLDRRGSAVTFLDSVASFLMYAATHSDHQAYLAGRVQRSETWERESAEIDAARNRATGQRLAAARKAKREAKAMEAGAA